MKDSIWHSIRIKLVVYGIICIGLTLITEMFVVGTVYFISASMGASNSGYGIQARNNQMSEYMENSNLGKKDMMYEFYCKIGSLDHGTLVAFQICIIIFGLILFSIYFWLFTGNISRDMCYISDKIKDFMEEDMELIQLQRQDEIGDIGQLVNEMAIENQRLILAEREALQTNKDLITCVAHDLRTPLTSELGYLQLAMEVDKYQVEERQKYARIAYDKANRLEGLIQDLFSYTKLMSGEITLHYSQIDVVKLLEQMVDEFYPLFFENQLEYHLSQNVDSLILKVDPELIARSIQNLVENAIKYGKDGKIIEIELEKMEREVQIRVINFGLIIPKESLEMIFEKFYRVEESRSRATGGSGLGLNIAKQIVNLHGGTIQAKSSVQGTCFTIALPLEKNREG